MRDLADRLAAVRRGHRQRLRRRAQGRPENALLRLAAPARRRTASRSSPRNHEFSSGQFEINLWHSEALDAADRAFRFKTAVQELARQQGKLATFMAKPFNDEGGSGFHLHFSTWTDDGDAALRRPDGDGRAVRRRHGTRSPACSRTRRRWPRCCNPTINSYKRFGPDTLAPWLIDWGLDNRSAMVRIPPERGAGVADGAPARRRHAPTPTWRSPALLAAAYLGIRDKLEPPAPLEGYGYDPSKADLLPGDLARRPRRARGRHRPAEMLGRDVRRRPSSPTSATSSSGSPTGSPTGSSASTPTTC